MKRLICILTCLSVIFSFSSLCAFATDTGNASEAVTLSEYAESEGDLSSPNSPNSPELSDTGTGEEGAELNSASPAGSDENGENTGVAPEEDEASDSVPTPEGGAENEGDNSTEDTSNPFEALYKVALEHAGEIFSALACLFSAILMLCYRKGIMPLIEGGIGAISGSVSTISREAERQSQLSDKTKEIIEEKLLGAEAILNQISASFEDFDKRLRTCEGLKSFENSVREILLSQIDLLYEVFMNSSLPQYEKDRIGEMVAAMKKNASEESETA